MPWRSYLFVPGDRPERFDKAVAAGADLVILDLEDAVLPDDKEGAREKIGTWLAAGNRAALRLNGSRTIWYDRDLELLRHPSVRAVLLPKAEEASDLEALASAAPAGLPIVPVVESALGIWNARELACVPGVAQLAFGSVDFQLDAGVEGEGQALLYARSRLVLASAIARIAPPIDGVTIAISDDDQLRLDIATARQLGFGGKLCIHPRQVQIVNAGFRPTPDEIARARRIVEAAQAAGNGAIQVDGKLIDRPVVERARAVLAETV